MPAATLAQLAGWLNSPENEHLECKEARNRFDFEELVKYCAALANEGGGIMLLGVGDRHPHQVVGTSAFADPERTKFGLVERLRLRIEAAELLHADGRVLAFVVPARPIGMPIEYKGAYWMRAGESLVPMTSDMLKRIFDEAGPDFSAEICPRATLTDLDPHAIETFRELWQRKSGNAMLAQLSHEQLLTDAELLIDGEVTYAALILFGTRQTLGKYLAQAEVIFEYRAREASLPFQQRKEYRQGFFLYHDDLWSTIDLRNEVDHYQDGFFVGDIRALNELVIREAILNAVSHRDYRLAGSTFVRQYPRKLEITSPGGFPNGITPDNILWRQFPRNRRIAEAFVRCGLVERSGQGARRMFEESIKEGKPRPDFSGTDAYQVAVTFWGEVRDPQFLTFLSKVGQERLKSFTTKDFLLLDLIHREQPLPDDLRDRIPYLIDLGIIERQGRGKHARHLLSRQFYAFIGKRGIYTRKRGLDRETNKALLYRHVLDNQHDGSQRQELLQVLPGLSDRSIQRLLGELQAEGKVHHRGHGRATRWYPGLEEDKQGTAKPGRANDGESRQ